MWFFSLGDFGTVFISEIVLVRLLFSPQSVYELLFYCTSKVTFSLWSLFCCINYSAGGFVTFLDRG